MGFHEPYCVVSEEIGREGMMEVYIQWAVYIFFAVSAGHFIAWLFE